MQGGREGEGGRGSKKVNEMENVAVMWSSTVAVAVAVAGCQTDWPENRDALAAVSDGFDRVLSLVARRRRRHNRVSTLHVRCEISHSFTERRGGCCCPKMTT